MTGDAAYPPDTRHLSPVTLVLAAFLALRVFALLYLKPGGYIYDLTDYPHYLRMARLSAQGDLPFLHFWLEYPPLFPWLPILAYWLSVWLPPYPDAITWYQLALGLLTLPFEAGSLLLAYDLARRLHGPEAALRCAWLLTTLFAPLYTWLGWLDGVAAFWLLLALWLALARRPGWAGVAAGIGFAVKLIPLAALPAAWHASGRADERMEEAGGVPASREGAAPLRHSVARSSASVRLVCGAIAAVALTCLPFALANPTMFAASFGFMLGRPSWQTVWAALEGYFDPGFAPPYEARFEPATAYVPVHPSWLPWPLIGAVFVGGALWLWWRFRPGPGRASAAGRAVHLTLALLCLLLLFSKGWSPQFLTWLLPLVLVAMPDGRGLAWSTALTLNATWEWPFNGILLDDPPWGMWATTVSREALLAGVLLHTWALAYPAGGPARLARRVATAPRSARAGAGVALALGLVVVVARALPGLFTTAYAHSPDLEALRALRAASLPGDVVLFTNPELYGRFVPFLAGRRARAISPLQESPPGDLPAPAGGQAWVAYDGRNHDEAASRRLERSLAERGFQTYDAGHGDTHLSAYFFPVALGPPTASGARFGDAILLQSARITPRVHVPGVVALETTWRALSPPGHDYTVFTHLIDVSGRALAQRDGPPAAGQAPTGGWQPAQAVVDRRGLFVPQSTPAGAYYVEVGLYLAATGERLPASTGGTSVGLGPVSVER